MQRGAVRSPSISSPLLAASLSLALLGAAACSSNNTPGPSTTAAAVAGPDDTHCGTPPNLTVQTVGDCLTNDPPANASSCGLAFPPDNLPPPDGGVTPIVYGATLYNATGYDDDCKYQLSWTATPVTVNANVTFTVAATRLDNNQPVHCGAITPEVYIEGMPVFAIPPGAASELGTSGQYAVGPIKFTQSGTWTVRFHLYEKCSDTPTDSPHGHVAFFVMVP